MATKSTTVEIGGREVTITNPDKVFFPEKGYTKLDLVRYYEAVADGALRGVMRRPMVLKRFVNGAAEEPFFQKRAPQNVPEHIDTARVTFPSGRWADLVVCDEPADVLWAINLGCIDLNPWPVRANDVDHPDELRIDLDPTPEATFEHVKQVAMLMKQTLEDFGYTGYAKTSGSRGIHIYVRIEPNWEFPQVRRAGLAFAREVERRDPDLVTTKWWKEERHGVFIDYNQNARDRTIASAYSVRPTPDARVSCPITWDELPGIELADFTIETVPERYQRLGDLTAGIDDRAFSLDALLELVDQQERDGLGDAPWPPQFPKAKGEPKRVQPSRARKEPADAGMPDDAPESPTGRRKSTQPLIIVSKAQHKDEAMAGLERWKQRHPEAAALLQPADILVDSMRGMSTTWTRIRLNLRHVPEADRPEQEPPDPDYDPWAGLDPVPARPPHALQPQRRPSLAKETMMSARWQGKRRYQTARKEPLDPFEGLGPGDPGYRLRGGRTGFDPLEIAQEEGRFGGIVLRSVFSNPIGRAAGVLLFGAILGSLVIRSDWIALLALAGISVGIFFLWAISRQDLEDIRSRHPRE